MCEQHSKLDIGYIFKNENLLNKALTHSSCGKENNEMLEWLGDSILSSVISDFIYKKNLSVKQANKLKVELTRNETLSNMALNLNLPNCIKLGKGANYSPRIGADAIEAIIGAVHLDGGNTRQFILSLWDKYKALAFIDHKSILLEMCNGMDLVKFATFSLGSTNFSCTIHIGNKVYNTCVGKGKTKKWAEFRAAEKVIKILTDLNKKVLDESEQAS